MEKDNKMAEIEITVDKKTYVLTGQNIPVIESNCEHCDARHNDKVCPALNQFCSMNFPKIEVFKIKER